MTYTELYNANVGWEAETKITFIAYSNREVLDKIYAELAIEDYGDRVVLSFNGNKVYLKEEY